MNTFCPVQRRGRYFKARDHLRKTLGCRGAQEVCQVLGWVVQEQALGEGGSWEATSSMGGLRQVLSLAPSSAHSVTECLTRAPLPLILLLISLGLFMLMLITLIQGEFGARGWES